MSNKINKKISIEKIKSDAQELFKSGGHSCSEAVVASIRNNIDPDMPAALVSAASGFGGGVGRSKCMCGTVSGAVLCLGYFLGRLHPTTVTDPKSLKTLSAAHELQDSFRKNHKVLCCSVHTKTAETAGVELKTQCETFVGEMAAKTAEIIAKELALALA